MSNTVKNLEVIDIVLSIYNQEKIIARVLSGIFDNTTTPFNLILIFDGCTDASMQIALDHVKKENPPLMKEFITTTATNVYETKANNIGFKLGKEKYLLTIQDDIVICEKGWERRLTFPIRAFNDVFAVSARAALNPYFNDDSSYPLYRDKAGREFFTLKRNQFKIRSVINRGPIAFDADVLRKLNFLDEAFAPAQLDEADLVLRAREQLGLKSGVFSVYYRSDAAWGKTRSADSSMNTGKTLAKNGELLKSRHFMQAKAFSETRTVPADSIDYIETDSLPARIKNFAFDFKQSLLLYMTRKYNSIRHSVATKIKKLLRL
ncbi:MAG: glycosyltransferase family A protein [Patescibacteria group bacterium]